MSGGKIFIDTNIALYLLSGDETVAEMLQGKEVFISSITQLELLGYPSITRGEIDKVEMFLSACRIIELTGPIKERTIKIKRASQVKLPDAIIAASSQYLGLPLITADKGFTKIEGIDLLLYEV